MSKQIYLIIAGLLSFSFLPNNIIPIFTSDFLLVIFTLWCIFGIFFLGRTNNLLSIKNSQIIIYLFLLLFLGLATPLFVYNQGLFDSIIALRQFAALFFFLALLSIIPSEKEISYSFKVLAYISVLFAIVSYINPNIFANERQLSHFEWNLENETGNLIAVWPGIWALRIYFFITVQNMIENKSLKNMIICSFFLLCLLLQQNRSTLIAAFPIFIYGLIMSKNRYRYIVLGIIIFIGSYLSYDMIHSLVEETESQLTDMDYNRWQAFSFFLIEFKSNLYTFLFGHGVPSIGSSYLHELLYAQDTRLAFISDLGMLGVYFYYGFIFCLLIYYFVFKSLFNQMMPRYIKFISLWIIFVPTIHHIGLGEMTGFMVFCYIIYINIYYERECIGRINYNC